MYSKHIYAYKLNRTGPRTDHCDTSNGSCCGKHSKPDTTEELYQKCQNVNGGVE